MKRIYILILPLILLVSLSSLYAHDHEDIKFTTEAQIKKDLPKITGVSNVGTSFWFAIPPAYIANSPGDFIKVFITSPYETNVELRIPATDKYLVKKTIPNDVIVFDLAPNEGQPFVFQYNNEDPRPADIWDGRGIHVTSGDPIVVYVVVRYQYTSDGFLALPQSSLGNRYVGAPYSGRPVSGVRHLPNMLTVVGTQDNTIVDVKVGGNDITVLAIDGGLEKRPGETHRWRIDEGDVIVMMSNTGAATLAGTGVTGNKPIAVLSGHYCADIPVNVRACDYNVEMDLPMYTWGKHYHVPKTHNRLNPGLLRIFAAQDNTIIYRNGFVSGIIPEGGGGPFNYGWIETRVLPIGNQPNVALYSGNKPISVTYYNPGQQDDNVPSDPYSMLVTPIEQYQNEITFCTPATNGGKRFAQNLIMVVYEADQFGNPPEDMEFGEVESGETSWSQFSARFGQAPRVFYTLGSNENQDIDPSDYDGVVYGHYNISLPGDGVYRIRSSKPFACYSYGQDNYDSYGYPTSAALRNLEIPDTVAPMPFGEPECDGTLFINFSDMPDDEDYRANMYDVLLDPLQSFNYEITSKEMVAGERTGSIRLEVVKKDEDAKAVIAYIDRAGNDTTVTYEYFAPEYTMYEKENITPEFIQDEFFGDFELNDVNTRTFVIENQSETGELIIQDIYLTEQNSNFEIDPTTEAALIGTPFAPLEQREFDVTFTAAAEGFFVDSIGVQDDCGSKTLVKISAAVGTPIISANDVIFDTYIIKEADNQPVTKRVTVWNNQCDPGTGSVVESKSALRITGYSALQNPGVFSHNIEEVHGGVVDANNPIEIPIGGNFQYEVTFLPDQNIAYTDQIVFESNAEVCDPVTLITGDAVTPSIASTSMDWQARRIVRRGTAFEAGDYASEDQNGLLPITIKNTATGDGASDLVVTGMKAPVVIQGDASAFVIKRQGQPEVNLADNAGLQTMFNNIRLAPDQEQTWPLFFRPDALGSYEVQVSYTTQTGVGEDEVFTFAGQGIVPNLNFYNDDRNNTFDYSPVDFGPMTVGNDAEIKTMQLSFTNTPDNPEHGDVLTITDIVLDGVSSDGVTWGAQGYRFDIQRDIFDQAFIEETDFPITLELFETITLNVEFNAPDDNGDHPGSITIVSDAYTTAEDPNVVYNNVLELRGQGLSPTSDIQSTDLVECVGNVRPATPGEFTFAPTGSSPVTIEGITLTPDNYLTITNLNQLIGTTLDPNDPNPQVDILIEYEPTAMIVPTDITLEVQTDALPQYQPAPVTFEISTREYTRDIDFAWAISTDLGVGGEIEIGDRVKYDLVLQPGQDISEAGLNDLQIEIYYKNALLKADLNSIELGPNYAGAFEIVGGATESFDPVTSDAVISANIVATGGDFITQEGVVISVYFDVWLPSYLDTEFENAEDRLVLRPTIDAAILNPGNKCAQITPPDQLTLTLSETCVMDLRPIIYTGVNSGETKVTPNPVQSVGNVDFTLAIGGDTKVNVYNTNGQLVHTLYSGELTKGSHSIPIPVDKFDNGTYVYEVVNANYKSKNKFVVSK